MLVVFIGAIGGLLSSGILGLFVGPVVLALGYTLVTTWLRTASLATTVGARRDAAAAGRPSALQKLEPPQGQKYCEPACPF